MPAIQGGNAVTSSAQIVDGIITNADISSSAAIAYSKLNLALAINNGDIAVSASIVDTKLATISTAGKVSGAALTSLASIPAGAGVIPAVNVPAISLTYKSGQTSFDLTTANGGTTVIAHGLGAAPKRVWLSSMMASTARYSTTEGVWDGSGQSCVYATFNPISPVFNTSTAGLRVYDVTGNNQFQEATVTVDATNITLTWAKTNTPTGTAPIVWAAEK